MTFEDKSLDYLVRSELNILMSQNLLFMPYFSNTSPKFGEILVVDQF